MASNQTEHYGLNQWSLDDSVIMAEFNADNAKTEQALLELKAALPKFQIGTYVGTGTCGPDNPCSLTFDFEPQLVIIAIVPAVSDNYSKYGYSDFNCTLPLVAIRGAAVASVGYNTGLYAASFGAQANRLDWNGNTLTWSLPVFDKDLCHVQLNFAGATYQYIAIG